MKQLNQVLVFQLEKEKTAGKNKKLIFEKKSPHYEGFFVKNS